MAQSRRGFLKKAAVAGAVAATTGTVVASASARSSFSSNGVVVGRSPKREITYKKTRAWDDYYRSAL